MPFSEEHYIFRQVGDITGLLSMSKIASYPQNWQGSHPVCNNRTVKVCGVARNSKHPLIVSGM